MPKVCIGIGLDGMAVILNSQCTTFCIAVCFGTVSKAKATSAFDVAKDTMKQLPVTSRSVQSSAENSSTETQDRGVLSPQDSACDRFGSHSGFGSRGRYHHPQLGRYSLQRTETGT